MVFYHLHWLHGQQVEIRRCCLHQGADRIQVVPADGKQRIICDWMLDEKYCKRAKMDSPSLVSADALLALRVLLDAQTLLTQDDQAQANASLTKKGASDAKAKETAATKEVGVGSRKAVGRSSRQKAIADQKASEPTTRRHRKGGTKGNRK
jgi:hypothetical protein